LKKLILILLLFTLLFSCDNKLSGCKDLGEDLYLKLLSFGESNKAFKEVGFVKAEIFVNDDISLLYHNVSDNIRPLQKTSNNFGGIFLVYFSVFS